MLQKASGDEQLAMEQAEPEFEDIEGDVIARTHEVARWRETGEVAYERDFAVRLTLDDERIVRIMVMPGGTATSQVNSGLGARRNGMLPTLRQVSAHGVLTTREESRRTERSR